MVEAAISSLEQQAKNAKLYEEEQLELKRQESLQQKLIKLEKKKTAPPPPPAVAAAVTDSEKEGGQKYVKSQAPNNFPKLDYVDENFQDEDDEDSDESNSSDGDYSPRNDIHKINDRPRKSEE